MPGVVESVIRNAPLTPEKVSFAWRVSVGAAVGKATAVRLGENGVLHVKCDSPAWAAAVKKSAPLIQRRLNGMLGAGAVKALQFDS
ncbi:MAG: DciA family protein [Vicinamibacterales bacterium]